MKSSEMVSDIAMDTINDLKNQILYIRNYAIEMKQKLAEICESAEAENYIDPQLLISSAESLNNYLQIQEEFWEQMEANFPGLVDNNYSMAEEILEDAEAKTAVQDSLAILSRFQQVGIDNSDVMPLLTECKMKALEIPQTTAPEGLELRVLPYKVFLQVVDHQDIELTPVEEEALESEFPRPIPRLLYQGKFYLESSHSEETISSMKAIPVIEPEAPKDEVCDEVPSQYTFSTAKEGTEIQVKEIRKYLKKDTKDKRKLLSMLNNCQVMSASQLVRWGFQDANLLCYYITPSIKQGYVTEISETGGQEKYFCLSDKGRQIFTKKSLIDEFRKSKWLLCEQELIRPLKERPDLLNKTLLLNEVALSIIHDSKRPLAADYCHYETLTCRIPYLTFSTPNMHYLLLTEGSEREGAIEEINGILNKSRFDKIVYLPIEDSDEVAWNLLRSLSYDSGHCYIARISDAQITYWDEAGISHNSIVWSEQSDHPETPDEDQGVEASDSIGQDEPPRVASLESEVISSGSQESDAKPDQPVGEPSTSCNTSDGESKNEDSEGVPITDVSSSVQIATQLLDKYNQPDFNDKDGFRESDFAPLLTHLLAENHIMETAVLAKALSLVSDRFESGKFYSRLLSAANLSLDPHRYTGLSLSNLDDNEASTEVFDSILLKLLRLSCFAWALCMPDERHDFHLYNYRTALLDEIDDLGTISPQLDSIFVEIKQIYVALFDLKDSSPSGFSHTVLKNFISEEDRKKQQSDLIKRAEELMTEPQIRHRINGVPQLLSSCFGKNSDLYKCMKIIYNNEFEQKSFVKQTLAFFNKNNHSDGNSENEDPFSYSEQRINDYIDKTWKAINGRAPVLKSSPRNTIEFGIKKRLDVVCEWLEITDDNSRILPNTIFGTLEKTRNQLLRGLDSVYYQLVDLYGSLELPVQAGMCVLSHTLKRLHRYLQAGISPHEKWEYIALLSSYQINLNKELKPNIITGTQDITGFEPWRRILGHIVSPKIEPLQAIALIDDPNESNWYSNYGTAEHLNLYLYETTEHPINDLSQTHIAAQHLAEKHEEEFKSELELKYAYGCIQESTKESIFHTACVLSDHFRTAGDIAHYRAFLEILLNNSEKETKELENSLVARMSKITDSGGLTYENAPILKNIEKHLLNQNLAVAEEYLNRLEQGEVSIPDEEIEVDKETDYHDAFLKKYERLYQICQQQKNKGDVMSNWGFKSIESLLKPDWTVRHIRNSEQFIRSWPKRKNDSGNVNAVVNLLKYIGFDTVKAERHPLEKAGDKYNHYKVYVTPVQKHLRDYPHPIASNGTLMNDYINVVCLFGSNSANELINIMTNKLQLGGNTIVLMDGALSLIERRKVAEEFKAETSGQNAFLLIDRVLMLYLATLDAGERLVAMFKCTLPYTFYQPYSKGSGPIADEMFYGRKAELNDILLPTGTCLVYGGRQLGKTALLERARSITHQPAEKKFALYIDIREKGQSELIERLNQSLENMRLIDKTCHSLEEICKELESNFAKKRIVQLYLFIDEADEFLSESSMDNYSVLWPFVDLKRKTKNQFKFVLAGLHNVARSRRALDNNGILPQLGAPLCIRPLSPADAKKLVERPLSYLGFRMGEQQLALILANTNYYPGILHFFCYTLVQSVSDNYKSYYSVTGGNPPYILKDDQMKAIFASEDLNNNIKDKLHLTLNLDTRYKMIANVIAFMNYEDERNENAQWQGYYDVNDILKNIRENTDSPHLGDLSQSDLEALLYEMADMGILSSKPNSKMFRFRKNSFLQLIGSEDDVLSALLEESEVASV